MSMENQSGNPIDHVIDLGLVNYVKHPSNQSYVVYRFADEKRAISFEDELKAQKIWFEKSKSDTKNKSYHLFGIHKNDYKKTEQINFDVEAKHKRPFIPFKFLRYGLLAFTFVIMTVAILGYCESQNKLASFNNTDGSVNHSNETK